MWWTTGHAGEAQSGRTSVYRKHMPLFRYFAHGTFGQMIAVMPEKELVIAHLAETRPRTADESVKMWEYTALVMEAHANLL
jgi:CubicO group peptidase (beta-lactamase class C family)